MFTLVEEVLVATIFVGAVARYPPPGGLEASAPGGVATIGEVGLVSQQPVLQG